VDEVTILPAGDGFYAAAIARARGPSFAGPRLFLCYITTSRGRIDRTLPVQPPALLIACYHHHWVGGSLLRYGVPGSLRA
jgi:hypothetical protein